VAEGAGPLRVLVVDDEPAILRFLRAGLGSQGYVVLEAEDGQKALDAVRGKRTDYRAPAIEDRPGRAGPTRVAFVG
jgi:two-component system KDP operon response regulator KdpE